MKIPYWWIAGLLALLVGIAMWRMSGADRTAVTVSTPVAEIPFKKASRTAANEQPTVPISALPQTSNAVEPKKRLTVGPSAMGRAFHASRDWRVDFESALQRPGEGGALYARHVLFVCLVSRGAFAITTSTKPMTHAQVEARQLLADRCNSFTEDELRVERLRDLSNDPRLQNDPLLQLETTWQKVSDSDRVPVLASILDTADPVLLEKVTARLLRVDGQPGFRLHGKPYSGAEAVAAASAAWIAAVCEGTGMPCGAMDPIVVNVCAVHDACLTSRSEAMAWDIGQRFGDRGAAVFRELYPEFVRVIKEKDASAFR